VLHNRTIPKRNKKSEKMLICNTKERSFMKERIPEPEGLNE